MIRMSIPIVGLRGRVTRVTNTLIPGRYSIRPGHSGPAVHLTESEAEGVWAALGELLGKRKTLAEATPEAESYRRRVAGACDTSAFR